MKRPSTQWEVQEWLKSLKWIRIRALSTLLFFAMGFLAIYIRSFYLHLGHDERLIRLARQQYQKRIVLAAERGTIFDRSGRELAVDLQVFSIFSHPNLITESDRPKVAKTLAGILNMDDRKILEKLAGGKRFTWIARRVSPEEKKAIDAQKLDGVFSVPEKKRYYPNGALGGQLLGAVGFDAQALGGIELTYDKYLKTKKDNYLIDKDAKGRSYLYVEESKKDFADIHLTIDRNIQYIAERELEQAVEKYHPNHAFVIVARPATGEILAVANAPAFDPNHYSDFPLPLWKNHAFVDAYEPGSTFKAVTAAAALHTGAIHPDDPFFCENGAWRVANRVVHDHGRHGLMTFRDIIRVSSNIGVAKIEQKTGRDAFVAMLASLGFGRRSMLNFPGESAGMMLNPKSWGPVEESNIAFGQGIAVTALQMVQAYGVFANGGNLMKPILVNKVVDRNNQIIEAHEPEVKEHVLTSEESRQLTEMLEGVVTKTGTAPAAALENFKVAGKTGTAQKVINGNYAAGRFVSSFIGYVPTHRPELLIYTVLDEPRPVYFGGVVAAPVFHRVADQALNHLGIMGDKQPEPMLADTLSPPKSDASSLSQRTAAKHPREDSDLTNVDAVNPTAALATSDRISENLRNGIVPNLNGLSLRQIVVPFNQSPYILESHGIGFVVDQSPKPGTELKQGDSIQVTLAPHRG